LVPVVEGGFGVRSGRRPPGGGGEHAAFRRASSPRYKVIETAVATRYGYHQPPARRTHRFAFRPFTQERTRTSRARRRRSPSRTCAERRGRETARQWEFVRERPGRLSGERHSAISRNRRARAEAQALMSVAAADAGGRAGEFVLEGVAALVEVVPAFVVDGIGGAGAQQAAQAHGLGGGHRCSGPVRRSASARRRRAAARCRRSGTGPPRVRRRTGRCPRRSAARRAADLPR